MTTRHWTPGDEVARLERTMTAERMRWYADALETVITGGDRPLLAGPSIHTDDDFARRNGLPSRVADGMVTGNWLSSLTFAAFGERFLQGGRFRVRFVRPVTEDTALVARVTVGEAEGGPEADGVRAELWCGTDSGEACTVGEAFVPAGGAPASTESTSREESER